MNRRKLPVLVDQAIGSIQAESTDKAFAFERRLRRKHTLSCSSGCSNCCYLPIEISVLEAIPIYRYLTQRGRWNAELVKKLIGHAEKTTFLSTPVWLLSHIACPLLTDDQKCGAYEVRPHHCRTMWATGDPHYCDGQNFGAETSFVAKDELMAGYSGYIGLLSKQIGMPHYTVPISKALLLAEKVITGQVGVGDILHLITNDLPQEPPL